MKLIHHTASVALISAALALSPGCQSTGPNGSTNNTANAALVGGALGAIAGGIIGHQTHNDAAGAAFGALFGSLVGAAVGQQMDEQQREWLRAHAPSTLERVNRNDAIAKQVAAQTNTTQAQTQTGQAPQPATPAPEALSVDDLKELTSAGVKNEVVTDEIHKSNSKYNPDEIAQLQQAGVNSGVIDYIRKNAAS